MKPQDNDLCARCDRVRVSNRHSACQVYRQGLCICKGKRDDDFCHDFVEAKHEKRT